MLIIRGKKKMVDAWFENPQIRGLMPMLTAKRCGRYSVHFFGAENIWW